MASGFNGFSREIKFLAADELLKTAHPSTDFSRGGSSTANFTLPYVR
jgi:hypothetical protein